MKRWIVILVLIGLAAGAWVLFGRKRAGPAPSAPPVPELPFQIRPATEEEMKQPQPPVTAAVPAPIRMVFEAPPAGGKLGEPVPVAIAVEADPMEGAGEPTLDLLLRLPAGVELRSNGWTPVDLPADEKQDGTGPWLLFQKEGIAVQKEGERWRAAETIDLAVTQAGTNWIVTTRARLTLGAQTRQTFSAIFASVEGDRAEFHTAPRVPKTEQRAQAN